MTPDRSASSVDKNPASLWEDVVWDQLLESIGRESVIPILGPALSTVEYEGEEVTLDRFIAVELAMQLGLAITDDLSLGDVVADYLHRRRPLEGIYSRINNILRNATVKPSRALQQMAAITHFKLFVTTSFDLLLEDALDETRFKGEKRTQSLGYTPKDIEDCEISPELRELDDPIVYHLLGKVSALPEYVVSDDDLLEYIHALHSERRRPNKLFDALRENNLLLLGGNFSDWLVRLFLRLIKDQRLSYPRSALEILADEGTRSDPALVSFLGNFSLNTRVFNASADEFIDELTSRWTARFGGRPPQTRPPTGTIFISYARQDKGAADALRSGLQARGFKVWFDAVRLKGGDRYDELIQRAIKDCSLFVPLLSQTVEQDTQDAYFRREWHLAEQRDTRNAGDVRFIVPIVVDESSRNDFKTIPQPFLQKHILAAPGGTPTEEIIVALTTALRSGR